MVAWTITFIGAFGVYLLFAGAVSANELICALAVAALAAIWYRLIRRTGQHEFRLTIISTKRAVSSLVDVCFSVARVVCILGRAALKGGSPGRALRVPFHFGTDHPLDQTRRACSVLFASLSPSLFVVDLDRARGAATLHSIDSQENRPDQEWLE